VTLTADQGEIYYTLNAPDPKGSNGQPVAEALVYSEPIRIVENVRIRARTRSGPTVWSEMSEEVYATYLLPLVVTEVMYNPPDYPEDGFSASRYGFVELLNIGPDPIPVAGIQSTRRPTFKVPEDDLGTIASGEYVVVVDDEGAFRERYGETPRILAEYTGSLNRRSQELDILGSVGESLIRFRYEDGWYPSTDGDGYSLVIRDATAERDSWNDAESWRASHEVGGSPGREDVKIDPGQGFQRPGDFTQDEKLDVTDAIGILLYLHSGLSGPCETSEGNGMLLDVDGNQEVNVTDAIYLMRYVFLRGPDPLLGVGCVPLPGCATTCGMGN
jgi:hypothetical protein